MQLQQGCLLKKSKARLLLKEGCGRCSTQRTLGQTTHFTHFRPQIWSPMPNAVRYPWLCAPAPGLRLERGQPGLGNPPGFAGSRKVRGDARGRGGRTWDMGLFDCVGRGGERLLGDVIRPRPICRPLRLIIRLLNGICQSDQTPFLHCERLELPVRH